MEQAPLASGTRLLFRLLGENSGNGVPNYEQESLLFANDMGQIISNELRWVLKSKSSKSLIADARNSFSGQLFLLR